MGWLTLGDVTLNVLEDQIDLGIPDERTNRRTITVMIDLDGDGADGLATSLGAILNQLRMAARGNGPVPLGTPTSVVWQPGTNSLTFDLMPDANGNYGQLAPAGESFSHLNNGFIPQLKLTLNCTAYGRGERVVATNLWLDSADFTTSSSTKTNLSATTGAALAPNGAVAANALLETTTNGQHALSQTFTKDAVETTYVLLGYGAPNGRNYCDLTIQDSDGSNGVVAGFDLSTGAMNFSATTFGSGFAAVDSGIDERPHSTYRCWAAVTVPASVTSFQAVLNLRKDADTTSYAGDTSKGIYWWGMAVQPDATAPGPYLETGSSLTITNGDDSQLYLYDVPGNCPALARLTLSDVSTDDADSNAVVINDWRIGQRSVEFPGDFDAVLAITPETLASNTDDDTVATTIASLPAAPTAQVLGTISKPASAPYTDGPLRVFLRARDQSPALGTPTGLTATDGGMTVVATTQVKPTTSASSHTLTYPATPTSGNGLVLLVVSSQTVTTPTNWTAAVSKDDHTNTARLYAFTKVADGTEGDSLTLSFGGSNKPFIYYAEIQGTASSSLVDKTASDSGSDVNDPDGLMTCVSGTTATTTQANEFALAAVINDFNSGSKASDWSNGFTGVVATDFAGVSIKMAVKKLTATGAVAAGYNVNIHGEGFTTHYYAGIVLTLKGALTAAPTVPGGTYQVRVAAVDASGNVGPASALLTTGIANKAATFNWTAPAQGTVDHYRVWYRVTDGDWEYKETSGTETTLTLSATGDGTAGGPTVGQQQFGQFRMKASLPSGTLPYTGRWVTTLLANGNWEILDLGTLPGTPQPSLWGAAALGWQLTIECKHPSLGSTMDADCVWLIPQNEPHLHLYWRDDEGQFGGLDTSRDWRYDLRPDRLSSAILFETGTDTDAGHAVIDGELTINTGAVVVTLLPLVGSLKSDVTNAKFTVGLEVTPRYLYLASS